MIVALLSTVVLAQPSPAESITAERLMSLLRSLPADRAVLGDEQDAEGIAKAEGLIEGWLRALGHKVHTQAVVWPLINRNASEPIRGNNLWIDIEGTKTPNEVIIIGAHYDAVDGSPGADDNGTGTVAAMEVARALTGRPMDRTVRVMFYTAEEIGLIGARAYAQEIAKPAIEAGEEQIIGMVSLEMLGYFTDEPDTQRSPIRPIPGIFEPPTVGDFIAVVGYAAHRPFIAPFAQGMLATEPDLKVFDTAFLPAPVPHMARSDHAPFWEIGVPAFMLTDTSNFRNPHYHQATDTPETIDEARFAKVVRAVVGAVHRMAGPAGSTDGEE
ncbi:MAG: M20/M25/M40 family metallo-hydrolase [Planctomycetota bacterium]